MPPDINSLVTSSAESHSVPPRRESFNQATGQQRTSPGLPALPQHGAHMSPQTSALWSSLQDGNAQHRRRRSSVFSSPALSSVRSVQTDQGLRDMHSGRSSSRRGSMAQLYQDIENEQELQVNRLFALIREQQESMASIDHSAATSPRSASHAARLDDDVPSRTEHNALSSSVGHDRTFYQAETRNLTRENDMLKLRIQELERQIAELDRSPNQNNNAR